MVPNFALSLSFDGIVLLRRMGPRWARLDEVTLDDQDFDAAVIALRDMAERLDPVGAQVALIIPNEQIRYLDQPDMGGDDSIREVAIRAALDGATPYAVADLKFDHRVSGGRLQIAAVALETLDEAQTFAREHGFEPVCFLAQAPAGMFDGAVFFGKTRSWTRAASRPVRPIEIVHADKAALTPLPRPEQTVRPTAAAKPSAALAAAPVPPEARAARPAPTESPAAVPQPVASARSASAPRPPADAPPADAPPAAAPPAAASLPAPAIAPSATRTQATDPATQSPAPSAQRQPAPRPASATPETHAPGEPDKTTAPIAFSTIRANREGAPKPLASSVGPAAAETVKPRFTPAPPKSDPLAATAAAPEPKPDPQPDIAAPDAPNAPRKATGFFARSGASALLEKAAAAADAAEDMTTVPPGQPARAPQPSLAASKFKALPPKGKVPQSLRKAPPPKVPGKAAQQPIPATAAARAAGLAAAPVPPPSEKDQFAPRPMAARNPPTTTPQTRSNPLTKLAALRSPAQPSGLTAQGGMSLTNSSGARFDTSDERERMTVFGERDRDMSGGRRGLVGAALSAALLLFLVGIAAWAWVFLDEGFARLFRSDAPATAVASLPEGVTAPAPEIDGAAGVVLESSGPNAPASSARPVARPDSGVQLAAFDAAVDAALAPPALSAPVIPRALTPEEAAATYAATGIWQRAPTEPLTPPTDGVDDIYVASIDPNIQMFDAVALPDAKVLEREAALTDPGLPPPAGLTFDFDSRDLVRATPEGALTPDGLRIFTGRPPAIPPLRPGGSETPAVLGPETTPSLLEELQRIRPEARPSDIIEQRERAELGGISLAELGRIRPLMRPRTLQEEAQLDAPDATDLAVRQSLVPVGRPRNMAAIVDSAITAPAPEPVQTAAVAPRTVTPSLPSSASVARAATVDNAINLNRINLIGVYGTSDNRRALVRLANGKYEKVQVGDRLDGGRVSAIGEEELRYSKSGNDLVLKMPR